MLLSKALDWAQGITEISQQERDIIMDAKSTLLYSKGQPWCKKNPPNYFDVTMGSYDRAETCELVGLFILDKLGAIGVNLGLCRDDGLGVSCKPKRQIENLKKQICKIFEDLGINITIKANLGPVDLRHVTLKL